MSAWSNKLIRTAAAGLLALAAQAQAADWPVKPVSIVVAGTPGGGTDAVARIVAADLSAQLKQSFVVDNRAGAGGISAPSTWPPQRPMATPC